MAIRWVDDNPPECIHDESGYFANSLPQGVSDDGRIIVGYGTNPNGVSEAWIWTSADGMRALKTVLEDDYQLDVSEWTFSFAWDISADGSTVVGWGMNPYGQDEGWRAVLPAR